MDPQVQDCVARHPAGTGLAAIFQNIHASVFPEHVWTSRNQRLSVSRRLCSVAARSGSSRNASGTDSRASIVWPSLGSESKEDRRTMRCGGAELPHRPVRAKPGPPGILSGTHSGRGPVGHRKSCFGPLRSSPKPHRLRGLSLALARLVHDEVRHLAAASALWPSRR